jgi:hypothetical protein
VIVDLKQKQQVDPKSGLLANMVQANASSFACRLKANKIVDLVTQTIKMKTKS